MQTRSFSKAFRKTILRMWWIPFLFAAVAGPIMYTVHEVSFADERFVSSGKILLEMPDGKLPDTSVVTEHEFMLESSVRKNKAKDTAAQVRPDAAFTEISIDAVHVKNTGILAVTCRGTDAELVRELLRLQFHLYMDVIESLRANPTPESVVLDLANVTPQVLEWPGPAVETDTRAIPAGLYGSLMGGCGGIICMLLVNSLWAFFRPAWVQPSLEEVMKAAEGLEASGRAALLERLVGEKEKGGG